METVCLKVEIQKQENPNKQVLFEEAQKNAGAFRKSSWR